MVHRARDAMGRESELDLQSGRKKRGEAAGGHDATHGMCLNVSLSLLLQTIYQSLLLIPLSRQILQRNLRQLILWLAGPLFSTRQDE